MAIHASNITAPLKNIDLSGIAPDILYLDQNCDGIALTRMKTKMIKKAGILFFVFTASTIGMVVFASNAFSQNEGSGQNAGLSTNRSEKLVVTAAVPVNWPPHYSTDSSGKPAGFAIDIMDEIARLSNIEVRYRTYPSFTKALDALKEKKVDLVPNVGIAKFRKEYALFTAPVETFLVSVFVRSGTLTKQQTGVNWHEILKGRRTAVVIDNIAHRILKELPDVPIVVFENPHEAIVELIAGRVDAFAYPQAVVHQIIRSIGLPDSIVVAGTPLREIKRSVAVRNDYPELHARLSVTVDQFTKTSVYQDIYVRWFGAIPPFWTTRQLVMFIGIPVALGVLLLIGWRHYSVTRLNRNLTESKELLARLNSELEERVLYRTKELDDAKSRAERYLALAGTMIVALDGNANVILVNRKGSEILGYTNDEIRGKNWFETVIPEETGKDVAAIFHQIMNGEQESAEHFENEIITKTGKRRIIAWHNTLLHDDDGNVSGTLSSGEDITENRSIQEQLIQSSKMATLGEMATGMAHELNQPLNIIRIAIENIKRKSAKNTVSADYLNGKLDKVQKQVERASGVIDHMRIFGRRSGDDTQILDPRKMVKSTLEMIGEQLRLSSINVTIHEPEKTRSIKGHQIQVEQVLLNLMNNSRDALRDDSIQDKRIDIVLDEGADGVCIGIEDTGGGIPPDVLPRIFEPFYTTKEIGQGTGLGLSISYGIISDMGGTLTAENTANGARFKITLPSYRDDEAAA